MAVGRLWRHDREISDPTESFVTPAVYNGRNNGMEFSEAIMNRSDEAMDQESTVLAQDAFKAVPANAGLDTSPVPPRCMALVQGSGPHYTEEVHQLLRQRLRIACSIAFAAFFAFLVWGWFREHAHEKGEGFDAALQYAVVGTLGLLCAALWTPFRLSPRILRIMEFVMFASMAFYFADLQFHVSYPGALAAKIPEDIDDSALIRERVISLGNMASNMRWFFLIVLYGMFIPNTWKRCAVAVGCLALTPIVLTFTICQRCAYVGPHVDSLQFGTVIVLSMACAMAIFGSHRISSLQQQAHQARKLGQYQLHRKLGSGGMGDVYLGEHLLLKRTCAIKLIRPEQAGNPTTLSRFEREVQAMATLTHWNTVEVYDYGRTADGTFYYVMEYLPGLSLQELVEEYGPLPPGRVIHFLRQLCAALKEAHAIGLIHRDIKPSNVIACQRGGIHDVAKLLDFGLVQDIGGFNAGSDKLTMQGAILGSPNYISPEQASGKNRIDARTDIYSLGALAYLLVTGQTPFVRETAMELLAAHMKDEPTPPRQLRPEMPHDLEEVILMCLRKKPDERFSDAESLDLALAACDAADHWDEYRAKDWWHQAARQTDKLQAASVGIAASVGA
jgi:eukaryotic-like serine/threonine-protein kinase